MGHEVTLYTFEYSQNHAFNHLMKNVEIITLNKKWFCNLPLGTDYLRWMLLIKKLSQKINKHDIINSHNHPAQWISKFIDTPTIWTCNEPFNYKLNPLMDGLFDYHNYIDQKMSSEVDLILGLSEKIKTKIMKNYPKSKVEVIHSGASLEREINHINNDCFDVIFVGPIHPQKRQIDILKALVKIRDIIPNLQLHFVGQVLSINLKQEIERLAASHNINIKFYSNISDNELYKLYDLADLSVFVPQSEPWGIFPLETIMAQIPTIISDQCGINDILPKYQFIIQTGNIDQLSDKILYIFRNYDKSIKYTIKIGNYLSEQYSWKEYTKRMLSKFVSCLEE